MDALPSTEGPVIAGAMSETEQLRTEVAELRARLDSYERMLQLQDAAYAAANPAAPVTVQPSADLPHTFETTADQLLPTQDGFYQLEWGPDGALRWTGPGHEVHFEAWIDRSAPLVATLRLFHFGTYENSRDLSIEVDGQRYALHREGTEKTLRSEPIAPRPGDGATRLTLHVPHIHSPSDRGAADKRRLGVAFQRLRLARA